MKKWKAETIKLKGISYLSNHEDSTGKCKNGHFNIIPACTVIEEGTKLYCTDCGTLTFRVAKVRSIEVEI